MSIKKIILPALLLLLSYCGYSQDQTPNKNLDNQVKSLQLNSSPAYVVLGVDPENIQRPNSPTDFIASVQSAVVNDKLQPNFAMETSPYYWGKKKPGSKKFDVYDYILVNDYWQNIAKSITLSFATSPSDSITFSKIPGGTGLGLGMHLQLVQGRVSPNVRKNLQGWYQYTRLQGVLESMIQTLEGANLPIEDMDTWMDETLSVGSNKSISDGEKMVIKSLLQQKLKKNSFTPNDLDAIRKVRDDVVTKSKTAIGQVNTYQFPLTREGFMLEFAVANASIAANSNWQDLQSAKTAIWLTPSYRFNINKDPEIIDFIDLMAVVRVTINSKSTDTSNYIDAGGKLQWVHNKLSLSAESIFRWLSNKPENQAKAYTVRTDVTISYKLNDVVTFKATFGSNFDGNSTHYSDPSKIFAVGGFHFGFSNFLKKQSGSAD